MAVTTLANHICNFWCKRQMHLRSILYDVNSMYRLMVDSNWMGIVTMTIEDDAFKPRTTNTGVGTRNINKRKESTRIREVCSNCQFFLAKQR